MGRTNKEDKFKKQRGLPDHGKAGKKEGSRYKNENLEKVLLVNMPKKKQGKFKKDFNQHLDKLLEDLELVPDQFGKININKSKKKESLENYSASFNPDRFNGLVSKEVKEENFTFIQNNLKKPHTNSKKELVKALERQKKHEKDLKREKLLKQQDEELDGEMDDFVRMMKEAQLRKSKPKTKTEFLGKQMYKHFESEKKDRNGKDKYNKGKEKDAFEPFEEFLPFDAVQKGIEEGTLYQGVFVVNEKNMHNSFIKCPNFEERIFFEDTIHKNRALHNAIVVFQITKGKPIKIIEKAESITEYEENQIELEEKIMNYHNPVEEYVQAPEEKDDNKEEESESEDLEEEDEDEEEEEEEDEEEEKCFEGLGKVAKNKKKRDIHSSEEENESDEFESESEEDQDEDDINAAIDEKELELYGFEKDDDLTPSIDDSLTDEEEDVPSKPNKGGNQVSQKVAKSSDVKEDKFKNRSRGGKIYGKIVYILDNPEFSRKFVCTLKKPINSQNRLMFACPIERKLPIIIVTSAHQEISTESQKYYLAEYLFWSGNSKYPHGHILEEIGDMGLIDIESEALLKNYNVYNEEFTDESFKYLESYEEHINQETREYIISPEEKSKREDLTNKIVFTCDPVTARDLDDALSITPIENDIYEIGVHIADVSYFVKEGTPLDDDARLRTTSVYLVQKVIPMLPRLLCENLCSLNPGVERLTFSVFFYAKEDGTIIENRAPRFTKSIIKTCAKLNYDIVQDIIEGKITTAQELPLVYIPEGINPEQVIQDAIKMNTIAQNIRRKRFAEGSMSFEREKKRFQLDEAFYPISYKLDTRKESNWMVEEYMLLANQKVGKFIVDTCQEIGLLRCHPPPGNLKVNNFEILLDKLQLKMNFESSKSIQESSSAIFNSPNVPETYKAVVRYRMAKILEAAKYFVVEKTQAKEWRHFALNFDVYTHFTSPIRRYPDVLVHRLLEKCLMYQRDVKKYVNKYHMLAIMDKCNECKINSKRVSDACEKLFMCLYMKKNPAFTKAIVLSCFTPCIEIYIPLIETEKKIFWKDFKSYKSTKLEEDKDLKVQKVAFEGSNNSSFELTFKEFEYCEVYVYGTDSFPIEFKVQFVHVTNSGEKLLIT